jgi:hypothetical protein
MPSFVRRSPTSARLISTRLQINTLREANKLAGRVSEQMKAVLDQAIALFGSLPNPHTLALFTEGGKELPITGTVKEAGLKPGEKLLLRPSTVRGG